MGRDPHFPGTCALRLGSRAAAVFLHAAVLFLAVWLGGQPAAPPGQVLVCTLDLGVVLPGPLVAEAQPTPAVSRPAPWPKPAREPAPHPVVRPKPASRPAPAPAEQRVSPRETALASPTDPASAPGASPAPASPAPKAAVPAAEAPAAGGRPDPAAVSGRTGRGFELSQVDRAPRLSRRVEPEYPYAARSRNYSGSVTVRFLVDEAGRVDEITVLAAEPPGVFEQSVLRAVRRWRFAPGERGGKPVPTWVVLPVRFELSG